MPVPTRPQIEANYALPKYKVELLNLAGTWITLNNARVTAISGSVDSSSNSGNPLAFGAPNEPSATVSLEDYNVYLTYYLADAVWMNQPVRLSFGFDTSDYVVEFFGPITAISKDNEIVTLSLGGIDRYLATLKLHTSIYFRKAIATKTTTTSVEDPEGVGYVAGLINYALWKAGGRPYEQQGINYTESSTGWKFWYSLDNSIMSPEYAWFSGDNTLDELYALARASGGQIYQDRSGVYKYAQPLSIGDYVPYAGVHFSFTDSLFIGYNKTISNNEQVGTVKLTYTERHVKPEDVVIEDKTPRFIAPSQTVTIELTPQSPVWSYVGLTSFSDQTAVNTMSALLLDSSAVTPTIGLVETSANRVAITLTNPSATYPMIIDSIKIKGRILEAGEDLTVTYGSVDPVRNIENNVYIQTQAHAERLARMIYDFYVANKPVIKLSGVIFDTDRFVGEIVYLASVNFQNDGEFYRIIALSHDGLGTSMDVSLVNVNSIPIHSDMFIIGDTYSDSDTRTLSY